MKNHGNYLKKPWKPTSKTKPKNVTSLTGPRPTSFGAKNVTDTGPQPTSFGAKEHYMTNTGPQQTFWCLDTYRGLNLYNAKAHTQKDTQTHTNFILTHIYKYSSKHAFTRIHTLHIYSVKHTPTQTYTRTHINQLYANDG